MLRNEAGNSSKAYGFRRWSMWRFLRALWYLTSWGASLGSRGRGARLGGDFLSAWEAFSSTLITHGIPNLAMNSWFLRMWASRCRSYSVRPASEVGTASAMLLPVLRRACENPNASSKYSVQDDAKFLNLIAPRRDSANAWVRMSDFFWNYASRARIVGEIWGDSRKFGGKRGTFRPARAKLRVVAW